MLGEKQDNKIKEIENEIISLEKKGDITNAINICKNALNEDPTNSKLHIKLGDLYIEKHQDIYNIKQYADEAITEYQRALESNTDADVIHYKMGLAFLCKGELDKALSHFNYAINYSPTYADAYFMAAKTFYKKDNMQECIKNAYTALHYEKLRTSKINFLLADVLSIINPPSLKNSLKIWWRKTLAVLGIPFDSFVLHNIFTKIKNMIEFLPIYTKGWYFEETGTKDKAIELYQEKIEEAPGWIPLYILLGDVYKSIGKYEEAINEYRMAIWIDPINIPAYQSMCQLYEEIGDYDKAVQSYKKLIRIQPRNPVLYSHIANILYLKGEIDESIKYYHYAINLNPSKDWTSVVSQTLGYVLHESVKNYDAAISAYQSAYQLNPNDIDTYISLGSAFYDKGDYDNAKVVYNLALELYPENSRIHCNLGYLLWGRDEIDEAIKEYELAIAYDNNYDIAYNNLGVLYLDNLGKVKDAIDCFELAVASNPNYALAYYNLGRAMVVRGDKIEAARLYQVALDINKITNELDAQEITERLNDLFE
ncbi:MAG: tetratricopeptide repeat protein [Candidatus Gastranaerophilales bacterium]|nr:tetratricopeptide repeat protein [Candidatus Gastranaerophilales bacterium]